MKSHVDYFAIETEGQLVALASAEVDQTASNAEMTDFATLPEWLGNRLSRHLLVRMEQEMKAKGIKTAYTITRAASARINSTFGRAGYHFSGRLKNNSNISGNIESMNVWYKSLACLQVASRQSLAASKKTLSRTLSQTLSIQVATPH